MLTFECGHAGAFAKGHSALVKIGHLRRFDGFASALVIEYQETFVCDHFIFIEQFLCARKISLGIDVLDVNLSFAGVLIFSQQIQNLPGNRRVGRKENCDAHLALERVEEALRFIGQRIFLVAGKIPTCVVLEGEGIRHCHEKQDQHDLNENI